MKIETFFDKFGQLSDAPNAVGSLRELVLELAVRGKLTEQRAADHNDSSWREFVDKLNTKDRGDLSEEGSPFEIPHSWRWVTLNVLGDTKPRNDVPDTTKSSFVPMTLIPAGYGGTVRCEERFWGEIKKGYTHFKDGDVVMAKITPCFENGKSAVMACLANGIGAGTTELHVFRRTELIVQTGFVLIYLKSQGFIGRGIPRMTGSAGQKRVPYDYFANSQFPLPPPAEQKRIVAKVDELMALCDRLEAQQQERDKQHAALVRASLTRFADAPTPANLDFLFHKSCAITPADLRKSILTLAVQGKLVQQEPSEKPQKEWFAATNSIQNLDRDMGDAPFPLPENWLWLRVEDVFEVAGGIQKTPHRAPKKNAFPYLGVGNVYRGRLDLTNVKEFELEPGEIERRRLEVGDLLIIEGNGSFNEIGRCARWNGEIENCVHQNHVIRCRPCDLRIAPFILLYLNSPNGMEVMQRLAITSSGLYSA